MRMLPLTPWLQYWRPSITSHVRLFCFPYAGGRAALFRTWPEQLPPEIEVCPVQLPGHDGRIREKPYTELVELIDEMARALDPYLDKPYAFFGHSMGSLISFEFARALRRTRQNPPLVHLFISGYRAPHLPLQHSHMYNLPEEVFIEKLRQLHGTPQEVLQHGELLQLLLPLIRADFALCETYLYTSEQPFTCPITVFGGLHDPNVTGVDLKAWSEQTTGQCKVHFFPGDHFYLHKAKTSLLAILAQELSQSLRNSF